MIQPTSTPSRRNRFSCTRTVDAFRHLLFRAICLLPAMLMLSLPLYAPTAYAQSQLPEDAKNVLVTFTGGGSATLAVLSSTLKINTTAGRLTLKTADIANIIRSDTMPNDMIMTLTSSERWNVEAEAIIEALFGETASDALKNNITALQSIRFSVPVPTPPVDNFYKILLRDGSTAIVDPANIALSVSLGKNDANLPLGTLKALKFSNAKNAATPETIFVRFASGNVYQLAWRAGKDFLDARSVSENKLRIRYADIIGILPCTDDSRDSTTTQGLPAGEIFRLEFKDGATTSTALPLQVWPFKTPYGIISLPSPLVSSFEISQGWRGKGTIKTIYGDTFQGSPDFKTIVTTPESDDQQKDSNVSDLLRVTCSQSPSLPAPSYSTVFTLSDGTIIIGTPYERPLQLRTTDGEMIAFETNSSLTRTSSEYFLLALPGDRSTLCKPESKNIDICLTVTGERIRIAWRDIQHMSYRQSVVNSASSVLPASTVVADASDQSALTSAAPKEPSQKSESENALTHLFQRRSDADQSEPKISLMMPWGKLELAPERILRIKLEPGSRSALVLTTTGDIILADMSSRRTRHALNPLLENQSLQADSSATTAIPAVQKKEDRITLRLIRGDILTGTLPEGDIPFYPLEKNDNRTGIPSATLQFIMRTGENTLRYGIDHGALTGKEIRTPLAIILNVTDTAMEIPMDQIESLVRGYKALPPTTLLTFGLPPVLSNEVMLPGGTFQQGNDNGGMPDETPRITVSLSPFMLDATEVTRAQFATFVNTEGYKTTAEIDGVPITWMNPGFLQVPNDPIVCVSWFDAAEFCNWRSRQCRLQPVYTFHRNGNVTTDRSANGYRLPTEAEWEFAAGGSKKTVYPWGDSLPMTGKTPFEANYMQRDGEPDDGWRWTSPVMTFPPTPEGIYDMAGNVWEWCEDWYFNRAYDTFRNRTPLNPCIQDADVPGLTHRVMRGGSYRNNPDMLRVSSRGNGLPAAYAPHVGFRCARNAE